MGHVRHVSTLGNSNLRDDYVKKKTHNSPIIMNNIKNIISSIINVVEFYDKRKYGRRSSVCIVTAEVSNGS